MSASATATQVPARESWGAMWGPTGSEIATASDAAPAASSSTAKANATAAARAAGPSLVSRLSAHPATTPAGTQATTIRASGWRSSPASCCSGRAARISGPNASACT